MLLLFLFVIFTSFNVNCDEIHLTHGWTISNSNNSITIYNQSIPSGIYSGLQNANITESIFYSFNDMKLKWVGCENWTYSNEFKVPSYKNLSNVVLVFHGIDTIGDIFLNEHKLNEKFVQNMFVRYRYDISNYLQEDINTLRIEIKSPVLIAKYLANSNNFTPPECPVGRYNGECHMNFLRKMQASFSWDWGLSAPSVGLWKPVIIELYNSAIVRDITYSLSERDDNWLVEVNVHLESKDKYIDGILKFDAPELIDIPFEIHVTGKPDKSGEFTQRVSFEILKNKVKTWWPNGYGQQYLYTMMVTWIGEYRDIETNSIKQIPMKYLKSRRHVQIGFRTIDIIETNMTNGYSFYFKVNNIPIFMKGTNWIPSNILPEKSFDRQYIKYLLTSVKNANMNMIRVWGGGIYETNYFYRLADEYGILIWQDMMFACAMYPIFGDFLSSVTEEIKQNVRRIQSHPSIAVWAGNNENEAALVQNWYGTIKEYDRFASEYIQLYDNVIKTTILENDKWHHWLYSSPSNGIRKAFGSIIQNNPQDNHYGDIHYYNYLSDSWNPNIYPKSRFVSEYGHQSFPSINSLRMVMRSTDQLADLLEHRQHFPLGSKPMLIQIFDHFPFYINDSTITKPGTIESLIYLSQLNQAMAVKIETELYRVTRATEMNTMGALYWQLNDVWVAPSWSSIEFNGNFKILQYWAKDFFAPISVIPTVDPLKNINLYIVRDDLGTSNKMQIKLNIYEWSNLTPITAKVWEVDTQPNTAQHVDKFDMNHYIQSPLTIDTTMMEFVLENESGEIVSTNYIFPITFRDVKNVKDPELKANIISSNCTETTGIHRIKLKINVSSPALFIYLQINHDQIKKYEFSNNGFMQLIPEQIVNVKFWNHNCESALTIENFSILTVNDSFLT